MPPTTEDDPFIASFKAMYDAFVDSVRRGGDCYEYADKIDRWDFHRLMMVWEELGEPMKCGFLVLNHGDLWLNNMMFKSDAEGTPLDVSLIDYQAPFWGSPSSDIFYFLLSSVADDIKIAHFDELVEFYHSKLSESLKKLKYEQYIPTLEELNNDLLENGPFGM